MLHYLKKNINPQIVYFGTFSPYFHIKRDFQKEHLYACGEISDYKIPDNQFFDTDYSRQNNKHPKKNKQKNKNKDHKEITHRIPRNNRCSRRGSR